MLEALLSGLIINGPSGMKQPYPYIMPFKYFLVYSENPIGLELK
jgi:hypothetical protein